MQPPAFSPSNELRGVKVLVVDDEADARELLTSLLGVCGGVTIEASSASEALALVVAEKPDVLVSDIGMPGEDGYSLIRRLRALPPEEGGRTPAAALTAYARSEDRRRVLDAGFDLYLTKPVNPDDFVKSVARLVRERLAG
jgi:CheY-like chemotaxis protein